MRLMWAMRTYAPALLIVLSQSFARWLHSRMGAFTFIRQKGTGEDLEPVSGVGTFHDMNDPAASAGQSITQFRSFRSQLADSQMKRQSKRKTRDALCLQALGLYSDPIGANLGVGRTTVQQNLSRAGAAGLSWPLPEGQGDKDLEQQLYPRSTGIAQGPFPQQSRAYLHRELRRKAVTLSLAWKEYRAVYPDGFGCSRFCGQYTLRKGKPSPSQRHGAGAVVRSAQPRWVLL